MKQLKVSLPDDLRDRIEKASAASGLSLGEEIRRRIERSLDEEQAFDRQTLELAEDIKVRARKVQQQSEYPWYGHPKSREALAHAVAIWLSKEIKPSTAESASYGPWLDVDDPGTVGRTLARDYRNEKQA